MKKKTAVRIISYLTAAVVCLGAVSAVSLHRARRAERAARYQGEQAFSSLCDAVSGMDAALQKSLYAITPAMTAATCAEVYSRSQSAADALSALPFPMQELEQTAGFLSKTGDYAAYLLRRAGGGEDVSEEERENLRALSDAAGLLNENLKQLRADLSDGMVNASAAEAVEAGMPSLSDSFLHMEQEFPELPSLVYDGPFSSSIADRVPRMTADKQEIDRDAAALVAAGFLGIRSNLAEADGTVEGDIPCWRVSSGDYTVCVSRQGGYVVRAISSRTPMRSVLTPEDALKAAAGELARHDYRNMQESYHVLEGNTLTVTYCQTQKGVLCYPDMIKVAVAMDTGELLRFDAEAYLTSHTARELPTAQVSEEAAAERVPAGLTLLRQRLAVIPSPGEEELFCRELICENEEGQHYLLYFNAVTGAQEKILILLEDETGTLAL